MKRFISNLLILISIIVFTGCDNAPNNKENIRKVKCTEVQAYQEEAVEVEVAGKAVAASQANLSFRVAGVIDKVTVKEGQKVKEGDVLALLDDRDYLLQLDATQAEYDAIKAEVDRVVALYEQNSVSANDYDKAVNGLKQITAKLSAHKNALEDTKLRAPFGGTIEKKIFEKGEAVSAGMPVVSIVATSRPEIVVNLSANDILRLHKLQSAQATMDHLEGIVFPLNLIGNSPKANLNQLYTTRFYANSVNDTLPSIGMSTMVTLNFEVEEKNLLAIPMNAVTQKDGDAVVWIYSDGKVNTRKIEISEIKNNGTAIIKNGLNMGEIVVSAGLSYLSQGMKVTPLEAISESNIGDVL